MPTVIFERDEGEPLVVPVPDGGALVDVCDDHAAPVPFSCKSANCGACRVLVLEGAGELLPAKDDEREVLALFAAAASERLACQAKLRPGLAVLRLQRAMVRQAH